MKRAIYFILICCGALFCSCKYQPEFDGFADGYNIEVVNASKEIVLFACHVGMDKDFAIDADFVFNQHPESLMILRGSSTMSISHCILKDGKDKDRIFQFVFFNQETLNKYTIPEIVEMNYYDDLKILTFDQINALGRTVTYGVQFLPSINK